MQLTKTGRISENKRIDPDYKQINACIPHRVFKQLQLICLANEIEQAEAIRQAIAQWVNRCNDDILIQ